jgi:hypothetical protein
VKAKRRVEAERRDCRQHCHCCRTSRSDHRVRHRDRLFAHAVGETNQDLKALIGAARVFAGPGFLVPTRNYDLFAWCLANGLRLVMPMTLMSIGLYCEPDGAWLPSIVY